MNIILFGPPGIGKTTIIGQLKGEGFRAIDLEDVYPSKVRFQLPNMLSNCFIGAADLDPKHKYPGCVKVLLWLPQKDYITRRANRDYSQPWKANQSQHNIEDWKKGVHYDFILTARKDIVYVLKQLWNTFDGRKERKSNVKD